jgi:hypothetical protein
MRIINNYNEYIDCTINDIIDVNNINQYALNTLKKMNINEVNIKDCPIFMFTKILNNSIVNEITSIQSLFSIYIFITLTDEHMIQIDKYDEMIINVTKLFNVNDRQDYELFDKQMKNTFKYDDYNDMIINIIKQIKNVKILNMLLFDYNHKHVIYDDATLKLYEKLCVNNDMVNVLFDYYKSNNRYMCILDINILINRALMAHNYISINHDKHKNEINVHKVNVKDNLCIMKDDSFNEINCVLDCDIFSRKIILKKEKKDICLLLLDDDIMKNIINPMYDGTNTNNVINGLWYVCENMLRIYKFSTEEQYDNMMVSHGEEMPLREKHQKCLSTMVSHGEEMPLREKHQKCLSTMILKKNNNHYKEFISMTNGKVTYVIELDNIYYWVMILNDKKIVIKKNNNIIYIDEMISFDNKKITMHGLKVYYIRKTLYDICIIEYDLINDKKNKIYISKAIDVHKMKISPCGKYMSLIEITHIENKIILMTLNNPCKIIVNKYINDEINNVVDDLFSIIWKVKR